MFDRVAWTREYRKTHAEQHRAAARRWAARNPEKNYAKSRAWKLANPEAVSASNRKRYEKHKERILATNKAWRESNKAKFAVYTSRHRAKILNSPGSLTDAEIAAVFGVWGNRCAYCRRDGSLHMDHIYPVSRGGWHTKENIAPSCPECNKRKSARVIAVPIAMRAFYLRGAA